MVSAARQLDAVADKICKIEFRADAAAPLVSDFPGFQYLLDSPEQAIRIEQHEIVEVPALRLADLAVLQRFQVEAYRCDGRLQFMGDGVDETVVLLVSLDFAHQKTSVENHPPDNRGEEDDPEEKEYGFPAVKDDPTNVQSYGSRNEANPKYKEESNRFSAAGDSHGRLL